ncbi:MAG TPA: zinc ribbon domain-containing protein [Pyrinomonadaceae bacterium]|jgi:hypothetical protein
MYCSFCGTESTPGLNYCNRCGASLGTQELATTFIGLAKPTFILSICATLITLFGFLALIKGAAELARNEFGKDPVMAMIIFGMMTILIIDIMLIRQVSRLVTASIESSGLKRPKPLGQPKQTSRQLNAHHEPIQSVTENTTRTFEPVYRESNR